MAITPIEPEVISRFSALIIGAAKIGKTSLIRTVLGQTFNPDTGKWENKASAGTHKPIMVISADPGLLCVQDLVKAKLIAGYRVDTIEDINQVLDWVQSDASLREKHDWIFIDHLSDISERADRFYKEKYPSKKEVWDRWDDYNKGMLAAIKGFRDLPHFNTMFLCLPKVEKDEDSRRYIAPMITGAGLQQVITSLFDEVLYLENIRAENGQFYRTMICQPWENYPAGDRSTRLGTFEPPDLEYIRSKILRSEDDAPPF